VISEGELLKGPGPEAECRDIEEEEEEEEEEEDFVFNFSNLMGILFWTFVFPSVK